ncbi:MAG TPA: hypothetical protein RMH85_08530 [Polyangiaceae bacterium LLY-WYZ-15_(1-7)]|nr:hypothetical protein [Myxococcales bacterium]MBJ72094.1 hypothetical protein [Sandaracinus sp.]HJK90330.1 hypothetical protein [Polyangiaceae bacterium LLY-WYZ-15_(1-7)]HJL04510.1 hypothetical protein [Polyangiaceae bacterium LLY-WYZ-15_(1-7)]HJL08528.1 hypothetical protein [Polyangiaceae bacterium LLY-WYZ-15_(1-7)]
MTDEDEFHAALRKRSPLKAAKGILPILLAGVAALGAFLVVWLGWPFSQVPVLVLLGVPLAAGAGALLAGQKLLGTD